MDVFTRADLESLLSRHPEPCISIYLPTHRGGSEADPVAWRKSLVEAERQLIARGLRAADASELLQVGRQLLDDPVFWRNQSESLAFFRAAEFTRLYRLPVALDELVTVNARFHIRPLLPLFQSDGRFFVLAVSQNAVRLLQGTRQSIGEIDLTGVPRNLAEALLTHDRDELLNFHTRPAGGIGSWAAIFHGQGVGVDDKKDNLLRYFQKIDRGLAPLIKNERAPLVVAGVDYLLPIYRQASSYPHLLEQGIEGNPDRWSNQELHQRAWKVVQPHFEQAQRRALELYEQLAGTGRASADFSEIVPAAAAGRVEILLAARSKQAWGRFDTAQTHLEIHDPRQPGDEDLLELAVAHTLRHGQTVHALEDVPGGGPLAAIYRLPLAKRGRRP